MAGPDPLGNVREPSPHERPMPLATAGTGMARSGSPARTGPLGSIEIALEGRTFQVGWPRSGGARVRNLPVGSLRVRNA